MPIPRWSHNECLLKGEEISTLQRYIHSPHWLSSSEPGDCNQGGEDTRAVGTKWYACVTGAAGYLASWLVKRLLLSGYHVRGTVRDPGDEKKVGYLWALEGAEERLELVKADLMEEGSFDDAIMGCEAVFHAASPVVIVKSTQRHLLISHPYQTPPIS